MSGLNGKSVYEDYNQCKVNRRGPHAERGMAMSFCLVLHTYMNYKQKAP